MSDFPKRVLIIGAGPTGLTAALELARQGLQPDIVDKKPAPSSLSRAVGIMPASIQALAASGVGQAVLGEALPLQRVRFHRGSRCLANLDFSDITEPAERIRALPQDRTEQLMSDALQRMGVQVKYNSRVEGLKTDGHQATVTIADETQQNYDWVIAADGVKSVVRQQLNIPYVGYDLPEKWSIADVDYTGDYDADLFSIHLQNNGRPTIIVPIGVKRLRIVSATPDAIESLPATTRERIDISKVRRAGSFVISVRQADSYHVGRVLLAGDAAHCHSPVGGRGMNLGIADAVAAAHAVLNDEPALYSHQRHEHGKRVMRETERARKVLTSANPVVQSTLNVALMALGKLPFLKSRMLRQMISM